MIRAHTQSGSYYDIDMELRVWTRNGSLVQATVEELRSGKRGVGTPTDDWPAVDAPVLGESLFIMSPGFNNWWVTTPVVKIETLPETETTMQGLPPETI